MPASSTTSLGRRIVLAAGIALLLILGGLAWAADRLLSQRARRQSDAGVLQAAEQAALVIDRIVAERERQVRLLASIPLVVDAARIGSARAQQLGLVGLPLEAAERRFDSTRTLDVDTRTRRFLLDRAGSLDLAEVLVTERHGFNAVTTDRTSDFVQSDERWWQEAVQRGMSAAVASYDSSARQVSLSVASAVRDRDQDPAEGAMKVVYGLAALQEAVRAASSPGSIAVDVIDSAGRVLASSEGPPTMSPLAGFATLPRALPDRVVTYRDQVDQLAALYHTNGNAWRVVAHTPDSLLASDVRRARTGLAAAALAVFFLILGALVAMNRFLDRRITAPAAALAVTAESVAAGNLSVSLLESSADDELGRLGRATRKMLDGLRALTLTIKQSASETATMALDLTASSEEMAASSQQMAKMSSDLSLESSDMVRTIQEMAADANRLVELAASLTHGATEGVQRNQTLRGLSLENRARLDASARELDTLIAEVQRGVAAAEALATASREVDDFVALMQHMARQSKLLAFSASMEAKRAGPEGAGFVVVAKEVQRLADATSDAAAKTEKVVSALLGKIEEARNSSARSAVAVANLHEATRLGLESFGQVEAAVSGTESWTAAIEQAAQSSNRMVADTGRRIDALARGTEAFAAAMEQVAASAQQQSASSEEIVATATSLAATAERLATEAGSFRLEG